MNPTKPGWQTTEFWFSAVAAAGLALLGRLDTSLESSGLSPIVVGLAHWAIPLAIAWVTARYGTGRAEIKKAALAAGVAASTTPQDAAAALNAAMKK
jgi:hypothetical protein